MRLTDFIQTYMDEIIDEWELETGLALPELSMSKEETRRQMSLLLKDIIGGIQYRVSHGGEAGHVAFSHTDVPRCLSRYNMRQIITGLWNLRASVIKQWGESVESIQSPDFSEIVFFNEEIDKIIRESDENRWLASNYDEVTGTPNRRLFLDRLEQHAAHARQSSGSIALFYLDIDRLKGINKEYGYKVADQLLMDVSKRLMKCVLEGDTVSRTAGDEFGIIVLNVESANQIEEIARNILDELCKPFRIDNNEINISISIAVSIFPNDGVTTEALISNVDQGMEVAKASGRNQICMFSDVRIKKLSEREKLVRELRHAIESNELRLYYQPIIDLETGITKKAEALIRWEHPSRGLLYPGDFLPLAEERGLMEKIEHWVFAEATSNLDRWAGIAGKGFQVTINTSPVHFIKRIVDAHGKKPWAAHVDDISKSEAGVVIELTEDVFIKDSEYLQRIFREISEAGIELALDDFGTGYSSLAYLKNFKVNYIKIDQMFVRDNTAGSINHTIAETMIMMAHKIGMQVVAEGVETEREKNWLTYIGCDMAQGFLISKALSPDDFEVWLKTESNANRSL